MSAHQTGARPKKQRSPVEKLVVRGGIAVLIVLVLIELRAQQGHTNTVSALSNISEGGEKDVAFTEVESALAWFPSRDISKNGAAETRYCYTWQSVFKPGQFVLNVVTSNDEPKMMLRYYTGNEDPMDAEIPDDLNESIPQPPIGLSGGPGGGGEGRPRRNRDDAAEGEGGSEEGAAGGEAGRRRPEPDDTDAAPASETPTENTSDPAKETAGDAAEPVPSDSNQPPGEDTPTDKPATDEPATDKPATDEPVN